VTSKARQSDGMNAEAGPPPLVRTIRVDELKEGEKRLIETAPAERAAIAALLDLVALDRLSFSGRLFPRGQGRLVMRGTLLAAMTQTCVVSLEPVPGTIEVPVEIEFWPLSQIEERAASLEEAASQGTLDWPEPILEGKIDLGRVVYETLATALDPYPKRQGASFAWGETEADASGEGKEPGPFAALARLKPR
jgi:uncharacterized metal-binding protein YceD (DUF177 family)